MNFFGSKSAAERYSKARPYFHPNVVERIKTFLSLDQPLALAIDVGCGTGLSSIALKEAATRVVGVDASFEMITLAQKDPCVEYIVADAERLPLRDDDFDLMTLSQAFHWLERESFLVEARRVLRPKGWLVVYDNYFSGRMASDSGFEEWFQQNYPKRFPAPAKATLRFEERDAENEGFHLLKHDQYLNSMRFSLKALVDYLLTHSNVIAAVEFGVEDLAEVRYWLTENIKVFYRKQREAEFLFAGVIWYLQTPD